MIFVAPTFHYTKQTWGSSESEGMVIVTINHIWLSVLQQSHSCVRVFITNHPAKIISLREKHIEWSMEFNSNTFSLKWLLSSCFQSLFCLYHVIISRTQQNILTLWIPFWKMCFWLFFPSLLHSTHGFPKIKFLCGWWHPQTLDFIVLVFWYGSTFTEI